MKSSRNLVELSLETFSLVLLSGLEAAPLCTHSTHCCPENYSTVHGSSSHTVWFLSYIRLMSCTGKVCVDVKDCDMCFYPAVVPLTFPVCPLHSRSNNDLEFCLMHALHFFIIFSLVVAFSSSFPLL